MILPTGTIERGEMIILVLNIKKQVEGGWQGETEETEKGGWAGRGQVRSL